MRVPQDPDADRAGVAAAPRRPIPRGARARERVLRAALDVLAEQGLGGFTMEAVAARSGASKATVYRHWTSRGTLLVDAMDRSFQPPPTPTTGTLRTDLIELLRGAEALLTDSPFPRLMAAFIDAAERDPALARLHVELTERRREPVRRALSAAQERGELPPDADVELAVDLLVSPAFYRRFIAHRPFPGDSAPAIVDAVLTAVAGGPGST
jgi:AcrR family transcriptional regulator